MPPNGRFWWLSELAAQVHADRDLIGPALLCAGCRWRGLERRRWNICWSRRVWRWIHTPRGLAAGLVLLLLPGTAGSAPTEPATDSPHLAAPQGLGTVRAMAWSPDGKRLAVIHDAPSMSGEHGLSLIDAVSWRETMRLVDGERQSVDGVAISPGGTLLFSLPDFTSAMRLIAAPGRDATFVESLSTGQVHASGADAQRFVVCRAGRAMLPAPACQAGPP